MICSNRLKEYFTSIKNNILYINKIADEARKKGLDPEDFVEMPIVENMAERVEGLISVVAPKIKNSGVSERIKKLEGQYGSLDWRVALTIGLEVAQEKFCRFEKKKEAMEIGIRTGFAYLTMGIVASPLEGFVELDIKKRRDGKEYFSLSYAGPVRSAGGTGASVSVLLADYIRKNMGYEAYDPTEEEAKRLVTELYDYHERITNLQYLPSEDEIYFLGKHLPIQIDGDGSEKIEVSLYKDLDRIATNKIRNGVCLTLGEGIAQKSEKLWKQLSKWGNDFGLEHWGFMKDFVDLKKRIHAKGVTVSNGKEQAKILPDFTYIKDLVGGRPIFTHPMREGGFRLRFGRSRTSGYSSYSIHPATMAILNNYIAIGTQLKNERPGKGCTVTACDTIEGPVVKLKNGNVLYLDKASTARRVRDDVKKIIYLGDILMNYGDFFNRAHKLVPPGYCEEWWIQEFEKAIVNLFGTIDYDKVSEFTQIPLGLIEKIFSDPLRDFPSGKHALKISELFKIPLHPKYTYHFKSLSMDEFKLLVESVRNAKLKKEDEKTKLIITECGGNKSVFEKIGVPHIYFANEYIIIEGGHADVLEKILSITIDEGKDILSNISSCGIKIRDKSGLFIGTRMGRPEKAKMRHLTGSPHVLFPVGNEGGRLRSFQSAIQSGKITGDFPIYYCGKCKKQTIFRRCEACGKKTKSLYNCKICGTNEKEVCDHGQKKSYLNQEIDIRHYFHQALKIINMTSYPDLIKGVRGTSNKSHIPEHLSKGILRAKYGVFVNKDGTVRYDMTQLPITHFKPIEIGTPIQRLKELGYLFDIYGKELTEPTQILEILPQDIILPKCENSPEEGAHEVLKRVCDFIDDLLVNFYGISPYYNCKTHQDLVGHITLCLAPHTSAAIAARIIGFSNTQGFFAHPLIHAATRRDCDGDEACVTMLMDAFLNFSRHYLPAHRGSTQDAPLVITWLLTPAEVDDMVFDLDIVSKYPLEFYEACMEYKKPWEVNIDILGNHLGKESQYEGMMFTHGTTNFNNGVLCSAYKTLPSMEDKLKGQMDLAVKIRAVDESDVARLVIEKHFLKDTKGNLRKFSMQQFRCVQCNERYRRPPLSGKCIKCGGKIIFTISHGSIIKYLQPSIDLARKYNVPDYLKQTLEILQKRVEGVFGRDKDKQEGLSKWF